MNEINFIPKRYRQRQAQRAALYRQATLIAMMIVCLVGWAAFQQARTADVRAYAQSLETQVESKRAKLEALERLQATHQKLMHQVRVQQRLAQSLAHSKVISLMGKLLPTKVRLRALEMNTRRGSGSGGSPAPQAIKIQFRGTAPDEMTVANLVATLSEHPVFSDVRMRRSSTVRRERQTVREFQLALRVNLQRDFQTIDISSGVAHAD